LGVGGPITGAAPLSAPSSKRGEQAAEDIKPPVASGQKIQVLVGDDRRSEEGVSVANKSSATG